MFVRERQTSSGLSDGVFTIILMGALSLSPLRRRGWTSCLRQATQGCSAQSLGPAPLARGLWSAGRSPALGGDSQSAARNWLEMHILGPLPRPANSAIWVWGRTLRVLAGCLGGSADWKFGNPCSLGRPQTPAISDCREKSQPVPAPPWVGKAPLQTEGTREVNRRWRERERRPKKTGRRQR